MAFAQTDLKKVLAYSTVSQLGFMFVAAGTGNWTAAIFHLGTHAFFKACLFLGAGSVMHGMEHGGSQTPGRHHDDGRPAQAHADHADHVHDLVPRDRRHLPVRRLLLEGRDPRRRVGRAPAGLADLVRQAAVGRAADRRARHRVLHVAAVLPRVRRRGALRGGEAGARVAGVDDDAARDPRVPRDGRRLHRLAAPHGHEAAELHPRVSRAGSRRA